MSAKQNVIDLLFEISWEVCNKVGGIYTVLSTKANTLESIYRNNLIFIGPDVWTPDNPCPVFTESGTLLSGWRRKSELPAGISVRVGRWEIPGRPIAILVKFDSLYPVKDSFYARIWQLYGVDSLHAYGDYDEACAFARAAALVIDSIVRYKGYDRSDKSGRPVKNVVAHFDEWTTGMGLLAVRDMLPGVATVFTTHATSIGRSICSNGKPLYDYFKGYDGDQMARELNMESKHSLEKVAAHTADAFTTVSGITADECRQLLDRPVDVVTPNGFEPGFVPDGVEFGLRRTAARRRMLEVASALTGKVYDPGETFILASSGRCEYRNKGIDVFLDSMSRLASSGVQRPVVAFVMVPAWQAGPRTDLVEVLDGKRQPGLPDPVITHNLHNYDSDPILAHIHRAGFADCCANNTDVIYVPCYLNGSDGIFGMSYYDILIGMDATVFPSYYEPWGYTPLESIAFGVPTITTGLSGFGRWILDSFENSFSACGVRVIARGDSNYGQVCDEIASAISGLINDSDETIRRIGAAARQTAAAAEWINFMPRYAEAYDIALGKRDKRLS